MNDHILGLLDGDYTTYLSDDSVETEGDGERLNFTIEFFNSINPSGMPQHRLRLKIGTVVMLLRDLNTKKGLCNGTKLVISSMRDERLDTHMTKIMEENAKLANVFQTKIANMEVEVRKISSLENKVAQLEQQLTMLTAKIEESDSKHTSIPENPQEERDNSTQKIDVIREINERQLRKKNLIVFNLTEADGGNTTDKVTAQEMISSVCPAIPTNNLKVCRIEHWMEPEEHNFVKIEGYVMKSVYTRRKMKHGGACILTRKHIDAERIDSIEEMSVDGQVECACVKLGTANCVVLCVYRTCLGDYEIFLEQFDEILQCMSVNFKTYSIIICGDFNINLLEKNRQTEGFLDLMVSHNLQHTVFEPTRGSSLLDNIFVNCLDFHSCSVIELGLSDHCAQTISIPIPKLEQAGDWIKTRVFSRVRLQHFETELQAQSWEEVFDSSDVNDAYNIFQKTFVSLMVRIFPEKRFKRGKNTKNWITTGIRTSCKTKRLLHQKMLRGEVSVMYYKTYASVLKKVIKKAKYLANNNFILKSDNKVKATWSLIRNVTGNTTNQRNTILHNMGAGASSDVLDQINDYFLDSCPDTVTKGNANFDKINYFHNNCIFFPTDPSEVMEVICGLKNKKSVGEDGIPIILLKTVSHLIAAPLSHIINLMFSTGVYPELLKTGQGKQKRKQRLGKMRVLKDQSISHMRDFCLVEQGS
nr:unnamed protein product [Callosobruchus analis]